jgi:formiminotetrahydrofolate cyclodeaminase
MTFMDKTLREFQMMLASEQPTPGGGTASAVALGQAAALTCMVSKLTLSSEKWERGWDISRQSLAIAEPLLEKAGQLAQQDSDAFDEVMRSYRLPKLSDEEIQIRRSQIESSTLTATKVPLETSILAVKLLEVLPQLALLGNSNAVTDVGVAGLLASAAAKGALFNVSINVGGLSAEHRNEIDPQIETLTEKARLLSREIMEIVRTSMN